MVRVPGPSGDSGFHRESQEDVKIKVEPGIGAPTEGESPSAHLKSEGYTDRQGAGRSSDEVQEEVSAMDLEEKPHPPPVGPSGAPADHDSHRDPPDEDPSVKTEGSSSTTTPSASHVSSKKKNSKRKPAKMKLKAPDVDESGEAKAWTEDQLEKIFYQKELNAFLTEDPTMKVMKPKQIGELQGPVTAPVPATNQIDGIRVLMRMLKEAGIVAGAFDANELFGLSLATMEKSSTLLFKLLTPLVGASSQSTSPDHDPSRAARNSHSGSSPFVSTNGSADGSVALELGSDISIGIGRMTLGPSGAAMLQSRNAEAKRHAPQGDVSTTTRPDLHSPDRMQTFFNAAMGRFLREQQTAGQLQPVPILSKIPDVQDVDMESVGSHHDLQNEFDPDDLSIDTPRRASAEASPGSATSTPSIPRVRMSAISELKEFSGKDNDEDRARGWLGKIKSAFIRDQASDTEKCIVFGGLLTVPARNWYQQLGRSTRSNWKELLNYFRVEYCGLGVSLARQFYHARKSFDESPLEYLHRLNVVGLRAKLPIKTGPTSALREHVEHFIDCLDDRDLADQLTLLRLADGDALADTLRVRQRAKSRQGKPAAGSSNYRQKVPTGPPQASSKPARAVRAIRVTANSDDGSGSESDSGSDVDAAQAQIYLAADTDHRKQEDQRPFPRSKIQPDRDIQSRHEDRLEPCTHCGSTRHSNLGCWNQII
ncbi:hypothetical protein PR001_g28173 [Phytophthora rubi]|uniref:Retrotransposon gag domain-containing protein n=1 Tax=Phytophthora rubi TaxID=129364 RepID=A0A6A3HCX1_9STRA|nr:hypothetical protein PR001_g28173 [Phytophthora rubi]